MKTYSIKIYTLGLEIIEYYIDANCASEAKSEAVKRFNQNHKGGYRKIICKKVLDTK